MQRIYIGQLEKKLPIFRLLSKIEIIQNGLVELFVKYVKRKSYCEFKIKISFEDELMCYNIQHCLYETDDEQVDHIICIYDTIWY